MANRSFLAGWLVVDVLVDKLKGKQISSELRANILAFYSDLDAPFATKRDRKAWAKLIAELDTLKAERPVAQQKSGENR